MKARLFRFTSTVWIDRADTESLKEGQEITLVDWGNCIVSKIATVDGEMTITATLNPTGDFKKTSKVKHHPQWSNLRSE